MRIHILNRSFNSCHTGWHFSSCQSQESSHGSLEMKDSSFLIFEPVKKMSVLHHRQGRVKGFSFYQLPSSTGRLSLLKFCCNVVSLFSTSIFMWTALLNLLTACWHPSCGFTSQLSTLTHSCARVNQDYNSFIPVTGNPWNSFPFYFLFPMTWMPSRGEHQDNIFLILSLDLFTF